MFIMLFIAHVGLWRTPSVLKRWKLNWCDLWIDGSLCFYKTDSRRDLEHRVSLKTACIDVRSGLECEGKARTHQVVVQRDPFDGVAEHLALGLLAGMAAGTAMRSFLWMPIFFC
uniref:Pleckstrin homology domain containing B1 n=1 Tax=Sander lucioperca TaxID=283035 RepID=A0A8C9YFM8_SANLU